MLDSFLKIMRQLDPSTNFTDLVLFDGAHNMQLNGEVIKVEYPCVTCLHAAEHGVALAFSDSAKIPLIKVCTSYHQQTCYNLMYHAADLVSLNFFTSTETNIENQKIVLGICFWNDA